MRRFLPVLLATSSLCIFAPEAPAADMPVKAPPMAAPVVRHVWTGCYIGGNVGWGRARNKYEEDIVLASRAPDQSIDGIVGGGQVGCDLQIADPFVIGIQGMINGTGMRGTGDPYTLGKNLRTSVPWLATVTGRVGVSLSPGFLLYVKGGVAWARTEFDFLQDNEQNAGGKVTRSGWTFGGGLEWRWGSNWSVFVEYAHLDFRNRLDTFNFLPSGNPFTMYFAQDIDLFLIGVNYRFGGGAIVARN